jgi:hypothetical protein
VAKFDKGERVERTFDSRVGVVRDIEGGLLGSSYLVKFDDGSTSWEKEGDLRPA